MSLAYEVRVSTGDWTKALGLLILTGRPRISGRVAIKFDGETLTLEHSVCRVALKAEGNWPGTASVPVRVLRALVSVPMRGETITLRMQPCVFAVEGVESEAKWTAAKEARR